MITDGRKSLAREFEAELTVLLGRVDDLDARVGEHDASQLSTTTTLSG